MQVHGHFLANSLTAIKTLTKEGAGIALMPIASCKEELKEKQLVMLLPDWSANDVPVHFVYQKHFFTPPKISAFVNFMGDKLRPQLET